MPDGKLHLEVFDVMGNRVAEKVDVSLRNQTLSDAPMFRNFDVRKPRDIEGLNIFPNGQYRLEIDSLSYHTVSRFIGIPPGGALDLTVTLPINPKKVIRVDFPRFAAILPDAQTLLTNSPNVVSFVGSSGQPLYDALDDIRRAGFLNLAAKSNRTHFANTRTVLSYVREVLELRGDRFFAVVDPELRSETINSVNTELFHPAAEILHSPPPGFVPAKSFKTLDDYGNLQLSFFSNPAGEIRVDMDIDDAQGFDHVFQVVGGLFGTPTHPYNIHEILVKTQELDPGYRLIIR